MKVQRRRGEPLRRLVDSALSPLRRASAALGNIVNGMLDDSKAPAPPRGPRQARHGRIDRQPQTLVERVVAARGSYFPSDFGR